MESLLSWRDSLCLRCGAPLRFRLSRFGCVFACVCGTVLDFQKALQAHVRRLAKGESTLPFFPLLEGLGELTTDVFSRISVEVDSEHHRCLLFFHRIDDTLKNELLNSLSTSLQMHMAVQDADPRLSGSAAFPLELLEEVTSQLTDMCADMRSLVRLFLDVPLASVVRQSRSPALSVVADSQIVARLPVLLGNVLKKHQLRGIAMILAQSGRTLLADDMGVGKTLQALGAVSILDAFPLLIICPSAVKVMWAEEIEKYLFDQVSFTDVHLIHGANSALSTTARPKIVVVSYHMAAALASSLQSRTWACVICDESHLLHTNTSHVDAQYTTVAVNLCHRSRYCLLLSGTPMLASPFDMFNQIDAVRPGLFGTTRWEFALRYVRILCSPFLHVGACTRPVELASVLRSTCLVRRSKQEVLDLPAKTRLIVRIVDKGGASASTSSSFQSRYAREWTLKRLGIMEAIAHFTSKYVRVVLFAHHLALLDDISQYLKRCGVSFVRIDGSVPAAARHDLVTSFDSGEVRVALMGITACAVGISLASAQCAVFCELPPDGTWLSQAEDRLHRLGQESKVEIYYLLGIHSSFDAEHFGNLLRSCQCAHDVGGSAWPAGVAFQHAAHVQPRSVPEAEPNAAKTKVTADLFAPGAAPESLQFTVSVNTGRIHVRRDPATITTSSLDVPARGFHWSGSLLGARECVRDRREPFWSQLDQFLATLNMHSPHVRRMIEREALWLPCNFNLKRPRAVLLPGSTARYTPRPLLCGWGFWWVVRRHFSSSGNEYFAPLRRTGINGVLRPRCLHCAVRPPSLVNVPDDVDTFQPGCVITVDCDAAMFCCGACREAFFTRRSSGALRRGVLELDRGVCAHCHVDCERLCFLLSSTDSERVRLQLVEAHHPHMLHFPALTQRLIQRPIPGNCWHADHVVPVSHGGGEASLDNVQTLCVACHASKTLHDNRGLRETLAAATATSNASTPCVLSTAVAWRRRSEFQSPPHSRTTGDRI